ncbi:MAG: hypothetical protein ACREXU_02660, partial [Gammaproteobacteria bacterium]
VPDVLTPDHRAFTAPTGRFDMLRESRSVHHGAHEGAGGPSGDPGRTARAARPGAVSRSRRALNRLYRLFPISRRWWNAGHGLHGRRPDASGMISRPRGGGIALLHRRGRRGFLGLGFYDWGSGNRGLRRFTWSRSRLC